MRKGKPGLRDLQDHGRLGQRQRELKARQARDVPADREAQRAKERSLARCFGLAQLPSRPPRLCLAAFILLQILGRRARTAKSAIVVADRRDV
jgi:hypothetical protein